MKVQPPPWQVGEVQDMNWGGRNVLVFSFWERYGIVVVVVSWRSPTQNSQPPQHPPNPPNLTHSPHTTPHRNPQPCPTPPPSRTPRTYNPPLYKVSRTHPCDGNENQILVQEIHSFGMRREAVSSLMRLERSVLIVPARGGRERRTWGN